MTPLVILASDECVTPGRAAKEVPCSKRTIQLAILHGALPALPVDGGRRFVLRLADVHEYRARYRRKRTPRQLAAQHARRTRGVA